MSPALDKTMVGAGGEEKVCLRREEGGGGVVSDADAIIRTQGNLVATDNMK